MITFHEIDKSAIKIKYSNYYNENCRYFKAEKNNNTMCFYGVVGYTNNECEAFLALDSFKGKVLTKEFFINLFEHLETLQYKSIYTWTVRNVWRNVLNAFGWENTSPPYWHPDCDPSIMWLVKRI